MNLQTYLMIKSAYYNGMEKDATNRTAMTARSNARKGGAGRGEARRIGEAAVEEAKTAPRVAPVAQGAGAPFAIHLGGTDSTANTIPASFITSESISSPMYTDTVNVDDSFDSSNSPISDMQKELEDTRRKLFQAEHNAQGHLYNNTRSQEIGNRTYDVAHRLADRGLKSYQYGGAGIGGAAGAGLGYAGSKWLAKKLGLKGRKAMAVKLLGTAGLGAAGAYGGYRLGDYTGKKVFNTHGAGRFPDVGFQGVEVD